MESNNLSKKNKLLNALSPSEYEQLAPDLILTDLKQNQTVFKEREVIETVYFPLTAVFSLVAVRENHLITELSLIGNEGMIGLPIILGDRLSLGQGIVQVEGTALKIESSRLQSAFKKDGNLQKILLFYTQTRLAQISMYSFCNQRHTIIERLARWLLLIQDCTHQNTIRLTHQMIANRLGCQRSGVTIAANALQNANIIKCCRGKVTVINREALENSACECYFLIKNEYSLFDKYNHSKGR